ncbi:MAG: chemotaxis protein CheA [Xanthobacteraceae bacterium]
MSDSMAPGNEFAQFQKTFFEECTEILSDMEERLGRLQAQSVDREELNAIFRAVHSIKAGAGAFNFTQLVRFSHTLEAMLDHLRDGRLTQDDKLSSVLIRAGDILADLVDAARADRRLSDDFGADVAAELQSLLDDARLSPDAGAPPAPSPPPPDAQATAADSTRATTYRIGFEPLAELFRHANEPLLLVRELRRLGPVEVSCDASRLPALSALEPDDAYLSWVFHLVTDRPPAAIAEVFEFVDEDCTLTIAAVSTETEPAAAVAAPIAAPAPRQAPALDADVADSPSAPANAEAGERRPSGISSIRVDLARVDRLVNMVGELVIAQAMLAQQIADQASGNALLHQGQEDLAMHTRELQECVMAIRMQPVKSVFARMPRLVREIATKLDKKVRLVTAGEQTEVDKTVIEELADPLTHMIRNSVDHGIEDAATRRGRGKPEEGTIELSASHRGGSILIQVIDDGAGLDRERLLRKGIEKGFIAAGAKPTDDEIDNLIFAPGFSTAEQVTDVSGRGVGMDVVRRNISNLGGRIHVQSTPGHGTRFSLMLPLTLAVLDGMLVAVGREKYILPLTSIVESIRPERQHVRTLAGSGQVVSVRGEFIRLVYLYRIFDVEGAVTDPSKGLVVLVETENGSKVGIVVDELIGQQQVVIKSLQDNFDPVAGISGATILGNGKVALILDLEQLSGMATRYPAKPVGGEHDGAPSRRSDETGNGFESNGIDAGSAAARPGFADVHAAAG